MIIFILKNICVYHFFVLLLHQLNKTKINDMKKHTRYDVVGLGLHTESLINAVSFASKKAKQLKQSVTISADGKVFATINKKGVLSHA